MWFIQQAIVKFKGLNKWNEHLFIFIYLFNFLLNILGEYSSRKKLLDSNMESSTVVEFGEAIKNPAYGITRQLSPTV